MCYLVGDDKGKKRSNWKWKKREIKRKVLRKKRVILEHVRRGWVRFVAEESSRMKDKNKWLRKNLAMRTVGLYGDKRRSTHVPGYCLTSFLGTVSTKSWKVEWGKTTKNHGLRIINLENHKKIYYIYFKNIKIYILITIYSYTISEINIKMYRNTVVKYTMVFLTSCHFNSSLTSLFSHQWPPHPFISTPYSLNSIIILSLFLHQLPNPLSIFLPSHYY